MLLDAILLVVAAGVIFGVAHHLRTTEALNRLDRRAVEDEVFAARARVAPQPLTEDVNRLLQREIGRLNEEGRLEDTLRPYLERAQGDEAKARERFEKELRKQITEAMQSVGPGGVLRWEFAGVEPSATGLRGEGKVTARMAQHRLVVEAGEELIQKALEQDKIKTLTIDGEQVDRVRVGPEQFEAFAYDSPDRPSPLAGLQAGQTVSVRLETRKGEIVREEARLERHAVDLLVWLETAPALTNRMLADTYATLDGVNARVQAVGDSRLAVRFFEYDARRSEVTAMAPGKAVDIVVEPTVQLSYEIAPVGSKRGDSIRGQWGAGGGTDELPPHWDVRSDPKNLQTRWDIPSALVGDDGRLVVQYRNLSPRVVRILHKDVELFYRVGGFGWNFLRAVLLMFVQLVFLAAVGVLAGSFLSFAVGCLAALALLPFSMAQDFLADATKYGSAADASPLVVFGRGVFRVMTFLLPDFGRTSPADTLVDGAYIAWTDVARAFGQVALVQAGLALLLGCLIFRKRELARVQV